MSSAFCVECVESSTTAVLVGDKWVKFGAVATQDIHPQNAYWNPILQILVCSVFKYDWIFIQGTLVPWANFRNNLTNYTFRRVEVKICFRGITHWGRVTYICVSKLTIIGSDNAFLPGRRQAIIGTKAGILLIITLWTNFSEI